MRFVCSCAPLPSVDCLSVSLVRSGCPRSGSGKRYNRNLNGSVCRTVYENKLETLTLRLWGALCAVFVLARRLCAAGAVSSVSVYADPVHEALSALGGKMNWLERRVTARATRPQRELRHRRRPEEEQPREAAVQEPRRTLQSARRVPQEVCASSRRRPGRPPPDTSSVAGRRRREGHGAVRSPCWLGRADAACRSRVFEPAAERLPSGD